MNCEDVIGRFLRRVILILRIRKRHHESQQNYKNAKLNFHLVCFMINATNLVINHGKSKKMSKKTPYIT